MMNRKLVPLLPLVALGLLATACNDDTPAQSQSRKTSASANPPSTPSSTVFFSDSGSGTKVTKKFTANAEWDLTFDFSGCAASGQAFSAGILSVNANDGVRTKKSIDTSAYPNGKGTTDDLPAGTYELSIAAPCNWTISAATAAVGVSPPASPPPAYSPAAFFSDSGSGTKVTKKFTANAEWDLTFDFSGCAASGQAFSADILSVNANDGVRTKKSIDTSAYPNGKGTTDDLPAGTYELSIAAPCNWTISAANS